MDEIRSKICRAAPIEFNVPIDLREPRLRLGEAWHL